MGAEQGEMNIKKGTARQRRLIGNKKEIETKSQNIRQKSQAERPT